MRWETIAIVWAGIFLSTYLHECAHGLTCKHYGGEVPDGGVLLLFFMPCFYCNVSDAWLIPEKYRRMAITLAGAYCDLCVWALCVFVWRLTMPDTFINYLALMMLSVCGTRCLLNLNPFLKLDGYYLLIDWLEMPNLRSRSEEYWKAHLRWWMWGGSRPTREERGWILIGYGIFKWIVAILFLEFLVEHLFEFLKGQALVLGWALAGLLLSYGSKRVFRGLFSSEFVAMLKTRPKRTLVWCLVLIGVPVLLWIIPMRRAANGQFAIRPQTRVEIHNPVEGFIREIRVNEGDSVTAGQALVELKSPDLESAIVRKQAEIRESQARLTRLQMGPRPEMVIEHREQVRRAEVWVSHATSELKRAKIELQQELLRLDLEIQQKQTELDYANDSLQRSYRLYTQGALSGVQYRSEQKQLTLLKAQLQQARLLKQTREMKSVHEAEAELTKREQDLAAAKAELALLEAGSRKEDVDAETARLARLKEELSFLEGEQTKLVITAPRDGVVATPHLQERIGQLAPKGGLLMVLEDVSQVRVEITVPEEDLAGLECHQKVRLKARSLPFDTVEATVEKIAPTAAKKPEEHHSNVTVYCFMENPDGQLRSGM
ncbi:MAG: efflux RND transporter periplasmic adaptor subunit, partial [Planctomycetaceae bacterium]|nr:efflux RND transporter periplasmic adaptor subunit [Planctomycetaceae bacterium]